MCTGTRGRGLPSRRLLSEPIKIVQAPTEINLPAYFGYSVGHWDGDTFVVETNGFNDQTPLDAGGHRHSDQLRVVERFRRPDFGHLDVQMTFDDPKTYTLPFSIRVRHNLFADADIFEIFPQDERDCAHVN